MAEKRNKITEAARLAQGQELDPGEKLYGGEVTFRNRTAATKRTAAHDRANIREDSLIEAIDMRKDIEMVARIFEKLDNGNVDLSGLFQGVSGPIAKKLIYIAIAGESEKNKLDAQKHLLALAGHSPVAKHAVATIDPNAPREQLISMLLGTKDALAKEGVELVDDTKDET